MGETRKERGKKKEQKLREKEKRREESSDIDVYCILSNFDVKLCNKSLPEMGKIIISGGHIPRHPLPTSAHRCAQLELSAIMLAPLLEKVMFPLVPFATNMTKNNIKQLIALNCWVLKLISPVQYNIGLYSLHSSNLMLDYIN